MSLDAWYWFTEIRKMSDKHLDYFIKVCDEYMWIHKDNVWGLIIFKSIQNLCPDCWEDNCRCLDHPWFNLKKKPKQINYCNPYR